jgi:general secretion pathway protein B
MSYILDALRRAENERERDRHGVPGVHAAQLPLPQVAEGALRASTAGAAGGSRGWIWGVSAVALVAAAAVGVWRWGGLTSNPSRNAGSSAAASGTTSAGNPSGANTGAGAAARAPAATAVPPGMVAQIDGPPVPAQAAAEANARAVEAAALPMANAEKPLTAPAMRASRDAPRGGPKEAPRDPAGDPARDAARDSSKDPNKGPTAEAGADPSRDPASVPGRAAGTTDPSADPGRAVAAPGAAARPDAKPTSPALANGPAPVVPLNSLAPELRSQIPPMVVGGAIYSDRPANRFVLINGQVVREGESPANGVTLERIGPKSAVLRWREMRFEMPLQ